MRHTSTVNEYRYNQIKKKIVMLERLPVLGVFPIHRNALPDNEHAGTVRSGATRPLSGARPGPLSPLGPIRLHP
jgi:hypothetical protein